MAVNIIKKLLNDAQRRAIKKGMDFNIDETDLVIPTECPILKLPLYRGIAKSIPNSPTIDRIDNSKGYIKGNVWVISNLANQMKSSADKDQLLMFSQWVAGAYGLEVE